MFRTVPLVHHKEFFTVHTTMVYVIQPASRIRTFSPDPAHKLSANLYDITVWYTIAVCTVNKRMVMDRGTVRKM